jgi:hypothetical protein
VNIPDISAVLPNVLLLAVIIGVVQWLKSTGRLSAADAPGAAAVVGVVLSLLLGVADGLAAGQVQPEKLIYDLVLGAALGFGSTAIYAVSSKIGGASASQAFALRRARQPAIHD